MNKTIFIFLLYAAQTYDISGQDVERIKTAPTENSAPLANSCTAKTKEACGSKTTEVSAIKKTR